MDFSIVPFVFEEIVGQLDVKLLPFVGVFFTLGYWLKRINLPIWCPKIPTLLFLAGFLCFSIVSAIIEQPETGMDALAIVLYGFANAAFFVSLSVFTYDIKHMRTKAKKKKIEFEERVDVV